MNIIAMVSENWGLSKENNSIFNISAYNEFFCEMTRGKLIIAGRKTFESDILKTDGKDIIVLSRNKAYSAGENAVAHSIEELFRMIRTENDEEIFIVGGEEVFRALLPFCKTAYITRVKKYAEADRFMPDFSKLISWKLADCIGEVQEGGLSFSFEMYENQNPVEYVKPRKNAQTA